MADHLDPLRTLATAHLAPPEDVAGLRSRVRRRRRRAQVVAAGMLAGFALVILGSLAVIRSEEHTAPVVTPSPEVTSTTIEGTGAVPSQSPADAARDRVLPVVADAPMAARVDAKAKIEAPEGRWVLSRAPVALERLDRVGGCVDDQGSALWGVAEGCLAGYGEVLLLDEAGRIERAFPMPGVPPTWIAVDGDFVYAGRRGDGGFPDSTLVRIDRRTFRSDVLVFRADAAVSDAPTLPGWAEAGARGPLDAIVDPPGGGRTEVTSWTEPGLRIDLSAAAGLFEATAS